MSSFKFKKGDLVEVTKSVYGYKGYRFFISEKKVQLLKSGYFGNTYKSNIEDETSATGYRWSAEEKLKLVNPDGDSLSEDTFEELLLSLNNTKETTNA